MAVISPGLAHEPNRWRVEKLTLKEGCDSRIHNSEILCITPMIQLALEVDRAIEVVVSDARARSIRC
jgi:hypothetical protein